MFFVVVVVVVVPFKQVAKASVSMEPSDGEGFDFELRSLDKKNDVFSLIEVLLNEAKKE